MAKKRYEKPSITDPETGRPGVRTNYGPVGATGGCSFGDIGSACVNGSSPQGSPTSCNVGHTPTVLNCNTGTSAGDACVSGNDAVGGCNTGLRDASFCQNGSAAQASCNTGTTVT